MSLHTYPDVEQRSDEWFALRRGIVTASVVGRLVTVGHLSAIDYECPECSAIPSSPCVSKVKRNGETGAAIKTMHLGRTAESVARKDESPPVLGVADNDDSRGLTALLVAERITGYTEPSFINSDMWRGIEDEPRARDHYSANYAPVTESGFMVEDKWGFSLGFSPDGLVDDDGLIECKSRRAKKQIQTILADQVPAENMAQIQAGLLVTGREWCDYVSYCGGMPMWVIRVHPDEQWFGAIVDAVTALEDAAAVMVEAYTKATAGMPVTERVDLEIAI